MEGSMKELSKYRYQRACEVLHDAKCLLDEGSFHASVNCSYSAIIDIKDYEKTLATLELLGELAKGKQSGEESGWGSSADAREHFKRKVSTVF